MPHDYIPGKEGQFFEWQDNLYSIVKKKRVAWGIQDEDFDMLTAKQEAYVTAYDVASIGKKGTRTAAQVKVKYDTTRQYKKTLRIFVKRWLAFNSKVTDGERTALCITIQYKKRGKTKTPDTVPHIATLPLKGSRIKIFVRQQPDAEGSSRRGRPRGTSGFELAIWTGPVKDANPNNCSIRKLYGRSPVVYSFDTDFAGQRLVLFARWVGKNHQPGPWSKGAVQIVTD